VYLSEERWHYIIEPHNHPEMAAYEEHLKETIRTGTRQQDSLNPAIPGRAGTGRRTTGKKDSDRLRAGEPTPFRGWKTKREQKMSCGMGVERQAGERLRKPTSGAARGRGAEHYE
jgi:hypothetical protein